MFVSLSILSDLRENVLIRRAIFAIL